MVVNHSLDSKLAASPASFLRTRQELTV